jgi:hypothetical protein
MLPGTAEPYSGLLPVTSLVTRPSSLATREALLSFALLHRVKFIGELIEPVQFYGFAYAPH